MAARDARKGSREGAGFSARSGRRDLRPWRFFATLLVVGLLVSACASSPEMIAPRVIERYPHDPAAFTQGLLLHEGRLYESTGLFGASSLREVDPVTGEIIRVRYLGDRYFGEGLALHGGRLIQLTWQAGTAFVYDLETFEPLDTLRYEGEGWGLCSDGAELWMSDGGSMLTVRDPDTFAVLRQIEVTREGEPQEMLNELECVDDLIYANLWLTDEIVAIDKDSGRVKQVIEASGLLAEEERASLSRDAVLNGIAYDEESNRFLLTGKLWPSLFVVELD